MTGPALEWRISRAPRAEHVRNPPFGEIEIATRIETAAASRATAAQKKEQA
ncbi:hypothetical protein [Leucobacter sp. UCD-THU]|uniref:hypothetical protein n=1 Tax=Leucobacter sp. UCD-THU TaxID=1292023 RepID=UPI0003A7BBBE|nr:hypothetical protein [Leucobacter sp. UCD-THU]